MEASTPESDTKLVQARLEREKSEFCYAFSKMHMKVIIAVCNIYVLLKGISAGVQDEPVILGACIVMCVVPIIVGKYTDVGKIPRPVLLVVPMIINLTHVYVMLNRDRDCFAIHCLSAYVASMVGIMEYSANEVQAYILMAVYFSGWSYVAYFLNIDLSGPEESVTAIAVCAVSFLWYTQKLRYQRVFLSSKIDLERQARNIDNLLTIITENIAVINYDLDLVMHNHGFSTTFNDLNFRRIAARTSVKDTEARLLLDEIWEFVSHNKLFTTFTIILEDKLYCCNLYKLVWNYQNAVAFVSQDVTATVAVEKELSKLEGVSSTLRTVTHEIKTPLNSVMQGSQYLLNTNSHLTTDSKEILQKIHSLAEYLVFCVSDIVDFTVAKHHQISLSLKRVNVSTVVTHAVEILHALAAEGKTLSFSTAVPQLLVLDGDRMEQLLLNVAANCLRYENSVEINVSYNRGKIEFSVRAVGVSLKDLFVGEPAKGSITESLRIRFEIAKDLLQVLGGQEFSMLHGHSGSDIQFSINADEVDSSNSEESVPEEKTNATQHQTVPKLLIVDDSYMAREMLLQNLSSRRLQCFTASNGVECLEKLRQLHCEGTEVQLIIMDCQMPFMDGWQCTRQILQLALEGNLISVPYILGHSAFASPEEEELCYQSGMHGTLKKPCKNAVLFETIASILCVAI